MDMTSLKEKILVIMALIVMPTNGMDTDKKYFQMYIFPEMDNKIPPIKPDSDVDTQLMCAMVCLKDVTCAAFSYGKYQKMCSRSPEMLRPYDVTISLSADGFSHFNVYEDIGGVFLPPGYKTFDLVNVALRFHYYWPKNWTDASNLCAKEGGRMVTVDEKKRLLLKRLVNDNTELSARDGLYVGGAFNGSDFLWEDGSLLPSDDPLWASSGPTGSGNCTFLSRKHGFKLVDINCTFEQPYVCEHLYFETGKWIVLKNSNSRLAIR